MLLLLIQAFASPNCGDENTENIDISCQSGIYVLSKLCQEPSSIDVNKHHFIQAAWLMSVGEITEFEDQPRLKIDGFSTCQ